MKRFYPKGRFARNVLFLTSGTVASQIIIFLAMLALARLYTPSDFGILATYVSVVTIVNTVSSLRYEVAIPLPELKEDALKLLVLSIIVLIFMTLLTSFFLLIFYDSVKALNSDIQNIAVVWLIPIGIFLAGTYQVLNYFAIRENEFKILAVTKLSQAIAMTGIQLVAYKIGVISLLFGHAIGQSAGIGSLWWRLGRKDWSRIKKSKLSDLIILAKRYKKFPLFSTWGVLINSLGAQGPNILFAILFSPAAAGIFFVANRVVKMPMTAFGGAVRQAFFAEASRARKEKGELYKVTSSIIRKLFLIGIVPLSIVFFFGEELFAIVFGEAWRDSGVMAEWLSILILLQFITAPISGIFSILEKQDKDLIFQANLTLFRIGSILLAWHQSLSLIEAVIYFSVASSIGYFIYLVASVAETRK